MIRVENLSRSFGGLKAVDNVSLGFDSGAITGLIGPNGAGKTVLFNLITGIDQPTAGKILLGDDDITELPPHELFDRGVLRTFQIAREFASLTVRENLMMVPGNQPGEKLLNAWFRPGQVAAVEEQNGKRADEVIDFLQLGAVADEPAGNLSGGQKKLVELARTMMVDARIVFLDEAGAGVNLTLLKVISDAILRLNRDFGYTFCVIEHNMDFIAKLCDSVIVMAGGSVLTQGTVDEVSADDRVIEAYLGTKSAKKARG